MKVFLRILVIGLFIYPVSAPAQTEFRIIRDTEIEQTLESWMAPLLKAAGMGPESVNLVLVESSEVNAFVAGGANIFVYTGLLQKTENPGEVIGVLAHELGHISGGHLLNTRQAFERASYESILGMILGAGTAIATGNGAAASAIITGSQNVAQRRYLANSRVYESSADQAALRFLDTAEINPEGLRSFLQKLESQELLPTDQQTEYVLTHPLTRNRVEALQTSIQKSAFKNVDFPESWYEDHKRLKAKLMGYIDPGRVPWVYSDRDTSASAIYAWAIAAYRQNNVNEALVAVDTLLRREPKNPYFYELKAQILKEAGRVPESVGFYRQAVFLLPNAGLIRIDLAHALMQSENDPETYQKVIVHLNRALKDEPRSTRIHRLLATVYGKQGKTGLAKLHLAEEAVLQREFPYAKAQVEAAMKDIKKDTPEWIRAKDLLAHIEHVQKDT